MSLHYIVKKKQVAAERLLRTQTTFSKSVMVSVGMSKLGVTDLISVDPGAKVNGAYYHDVYALDLKRNNNRRCTACS